MKRVFILAEGQTEETFIRNILAPHLGNLGIYPITTVITTKRRKDGTTFKGGVTSYVKLRRDILRLLQDTNVVAVTTMLDYYGLPDDFPGKSMLTGQTPYDRVVYLEHEFSEDVNNRRFSPFLTLHEFEALLFVQPDAILSAFPGLSAVRRKDFQQEMNTLPAPEEINEGANTHPSRRIISFIPKYRKTLHGPLIVERIGLSEIRNKCPHLHGWITHLENL